MGLRDEITASVAAAFNADLSDAVAAFTGSRFVASGPINPITQEPVGATVTYTGRGVFGGFASQVVDGLHILRTDTKLTTLQAEVSDVPQVGDTIQRGSTAYTIIHVGQDAAGVSWTLQLRGD